MHVSMAGTDLREGDENGVEEQDEMGGMGGFL